MKSTLLKLTIVLATITCIQAQSTKPGVASSAFIKKYTGYTVNWSLNAENGSDHGSNNYGITYIWENISNDGCYLTISGKENNEKYPSKSIYNVIDFRLHYKDWRYRVVNSAYGSKIFLYRRPSNADANYWVMHDVMIRIGLNDSQTFIKDLKALANECGAQFLETTEDITGKPITK